MTLARDILGADNGARTYTLSSATGPAEDIAGELYRDDIDNGRAVPRVAHTCADNGRTLSPARFNARGRDAHSRTLDGAENPAPVVDIVARALAEYDAGAASELREGSRAMRAPDPLGALRSRIYRDSLARARACAERFEVGA